MRTLRDLSPIWIYLPWFNLGCLGLRIGHAKYQMMYCDFVCWGGFGTLYVRIDRGRYAGRYWSNICRFWKWNKK